MWIAGLSCFRAFVFHIRPIVFCPETNTIFVHQIRFAFSVAAPKYENAYFWQLAFTIVVFVNEAVS